MGSKLVVEETVSHKFLFLPSNFYAPSKRRPWYEPCLSYPRYATENNFPGFCNKHSFWRCNVFAAEGVL